MRRGVAWLWIAAVVGAWIFLQAWLPPWAVRTAPEWARSTLSYPAYLALCQVVVLGVGVVLTGIFVGPARESLALRSSSGLGLGAPVLLAPLLFVAASWISLQAALPTLMAEVAARGAGASREAAGEFGRALGSAPWLATVLWGAVLAALGEEMLFRGLVWSALETLVRSFRPEPPEDPTLASGAAATIGAAALFSFLHGDLGGGVGIVRTVSTFVLGLACGVARHSTKSVLSPIALHLSYNLLAIGVARRWLVTPSFPVVEQVPTLVLWIAVPCAVAAGVWAVVRRRRTQPQSNDTGTSIAS